MRETGCDIMVCDSMVRKYLPSMRAEMVYRLVQRDGMSQSDAAKRLGVTRAAISQYISKKRGDSGIEISNELNLLIDRWALAVIDQDAAITLCDICKCAFKKQ
ncbi:MAG TPA: helix-turn-helix domain-containing protein [Methanoregulaceae archaeon]|nr:helix-turn-helix domain-containing protein [Methanoregulaceae archaeon]